MNIVSLVFALLTLVILGFAVHTEWVDPTFTDPDDLD